MNKAYETSNLEEVIKRLQDCRIEELDEALQFWDEISDSMELIPDPELIKYANTICAIIRQLRRVKQIILNYSEDRLSLSAKELND